MQVAFYIAALVAVISTIMVITRFNIIHALLYLVVSFMAMAVVFFILGAPFAAALEVIVYAGAIVVLIIFVIMMLNQKEEAVTQEKKWLTPMVYVGPAILSALMMGELVYIIYVGESHAVGQHVVDVKELGKTLYGPYILAVELGGMLLMAGIVGAYHLGRQKKKVIHRFLKEKED
ncbi:MAG: NADH-ubiquinone oxidoreductase chain J [Cytophagales bacterium]|jgi:NADH-quinone oxidoreductase subunit J|nr:NADH-quinone oxidoreductase subunit J [Bacteroidota bacterium]MBS1980856.1 NADH-quinone oxidoreductase subunit J [Bacteroidota bacterium]WHZ08203.1 MAG: NADH-ubiquinone oxidoreductase chain J [Cytophagales bacterium]